LRERGRICDALACAGDRRSVRWKNPETGEPLLSCTMIITGPDAMVTGVHDRMPVPLTEKQFEPWLSGDASAECLRPARNDFPQAWPVSKRINSSKAPADDPALIDRIAP
jgi:putative SOS response-associated peptidase YedK